MDALEKDKPVGKAVRRLMRAHVAAACQELDAARQQARGTPTAGAVHFHSARKHLKKARAALRMIRGSVPKRQFRRVNANCRQAARALADIRDAQLLPQTLRRLVKRAPPSLPESLQAPLVRRLHQLSQQRVAAARTHIRLDEASQRLRRANRRIREMTIKKRGWEAIEDGVLDTYAKASGAYVKTVDDRSDTAFHEWRKQAKYVRYQTEFLRDRKPRGLAALAAALGDLTDVLGDAHDLHLLRNVLRSRAFADANRNALDLLRTLIARRQQQLEGRARTLGRGLFADKPDTFVKRLHRYWKA